MANEPGFLTIAELAAAIGGGTLDPLALTRHMLARIEALNPRLNLYLAVCREAALRDGADAADRARRGRRLGPLDGVPVAVKDNTDVAGMPTSNGLGGPHALPPPAAEDAEAVRRLRAAGAVILGKLNLHEAALGATTDNPHFGAAINPHRDGFTPGGSSGGSAAAVAAGLCAAALGSDSAGSIRIPAAYCGVVGFKPGFGLVSTRGVAPLSWRLDHVGPLTRSVADATLMFEVLRGFDPLCPGSRNFIGGEAAGAGIGGLRLGVLENFAAEPVEPEVAAAFAAALEVLRGLGGAIRPVALPSYDGARARRAALLRIEVDAALFHQDRDGLRYSPELLSTLDYGARAAANRLAAADRLIDIAAFELARAFDGVDAIVSPTTPQPAFRFGDAVPDNQNAFCVLANFAGCPAVSVPMGQSAAGLPLGLQIMTAVDCDALALRLAAAYEAASAWRLDPPLALAKSH